MGKEEQIDEIVRILSDLPEGMIERWLNAIRESLGVRSGRLWQYDCRNSDPIFCMIDELWQQHCYHKYPKHNIAADELRQTVCQIYAHPRQSKVLFHLWVHGASTRKELHYKLKIPMRTVTYILERFEALGIVRRTTTFMPSKRRHRPPTVYAIAIAPPEASREAQVRYMRLVDERYPTVREANDIAQLLLDDYFDVITDGKTLENEVFTKKIFPVLRKECPGANLSDLWALIEPELRGRGYRVTIG